MLVLTRKVNQVVILDIGNNKLVEVIVLETRGDQIRLGVKADKDVSIHRKEIWDQIQSAKTPEQTAAKR